MENAKLFCKFCKQEKPWAEFGKVNQCRACAAAATRAYRRAHPEYVERHRNYTRELRRKALEVYSNSNQPFCACCKESEIKFLEFDHINGDGAKHRKKIGAVSYNFLIRLKNLGWPQGLRVLCCNCHKAISHFGACPHQNGLTGPINCKQGRPKVYINE